MFSKALYMGVLQSVELEGPADGFWLLTWAVGFSETLQTYGPAPTFYNFFFSRLSQTMSLDAFVDVA